MTLAFNIKSLFLIPFSNINNLMKYAINFIRWDTRSRYYLAAPNASFSSLSDNTAHSGILKARGAISQMICKQFCCVTKAINFIPDRY